MRKKALYFFIVFAVIIVVLYLWRYKQSQVFENRVPANATKVVNVNLRQIENHLLFDFLANPITYLKPRKRKDSLKKPRVSLNNGVSIPRNILFYSNSNKLKDNWFSSVIGITDLEKLSRFLVKEKFVKHTENKIIFYTKANIVLAIKDEQLILGLKSDKKATIFPLLISLFDIKDYLREDDTILKPLINSESDISFSLGDDWLEADFNKGFFELQGALDSDLFVTNVNQTPNENGIVSLSGKINRHNSTFKQFLADKKEKFNEITHLSLDSIIDKWNGKLNMNIASIEQKTDTIVSYEYDDDFNKVEIKSTQKKKIPTLSLILGQEKSSSLSDYFYSKNAIQIIENDTVFTAIPIYKFLAADVEENFELYITEKKKQSASMVTTSKLNFYFNAEKYMENPLDIPLNKDQKKLLKLVKTTKLDWTENNEFSLKINLKNTNRNFLGKLIKQ
ncbi:hypothetical protein [Aureibaculum conchae]|uniref:hypothetical protein n=1 Tax=Aureibaculum sp. 2308TA14-22 TaxID=3108392 RepID=UPI003397EEB2